MNLSEAAAYMGLSEFEVENLLEENEIKGKKFGTEWRVTNISISRFLNG